MKLSIFKNHLESLSQLNFIQPDGTFVPQHFHITEAGLTTKHFIDCGGTVRMEKTISFQVWVAEDVQHRLSPEKLEKIIDISERLFPVADLEVEIEYQMESISRFGVGFNGQDFLLEPKQTDCLAKDNCGVPQEKQKVNINELQTAEASCCTPGGGCC